MFAPELIVSLATLFPRSLWLGLAALLGYGLMMWTNPARAGLRDGVRALRRYSSLWIIPGIFGFAAALFQIAERYYLSLLLPPDDRPAFLWMRAAWRDREFWLSGSEESLWWLPQADFLAALRASVAPAIQTLSATFDCLVATFPLSALAALLLVLNRGGHHAVLMRALRKRFGVFAWGIHLAIVVCALASILKPFLYATPQLFHFAPGATVLWFQWAPVAAWLSFLFEYLFGVFLQTYLILLAYIWVRGLTFTTDHLVDFSIRRFSSVFKWAAVTLVFRTVCIEVPLILKNFAPFADWFPDEAGLSQHLAVARFVLAALILLGATLQINLIFHSESWRDALRHHTDFLRKNWWTLGWFLVVGGLHAFALHALNFSIARGLGEGTALWVLWYLIYPWLAALITGWLLASWVCIYKRRATAHLNVASQRLFDF